MQYRLFSSIFNVLLGHLLLLGTSPAEADFSDTVETPKETKAVSPTSVPGTPSPIKTIVPKDEAPPAPKKALNKPAKEKEAQSSAGDGDVLSGNVFGQVSHDNSAPVSWSSENFRGSRQTGVFYLTGNVIVSQDNLVMNSESMEIYRSPTLQKVTKVMAKSKVHAKKDVDPKADDYIEAWGDEMDYNVETGLMTLIHNARVTRGKSCDIKGDILYYDLKIGNISGKQTHGFCVPKKQPPAK